MRKIWFLAIIFINISKADIYFINPSATRGKNVFDSRLDISRFKTENLFDTSGAKTPLSSNSNFEMSNIDLNFYYGLSNDFDLNLGIRGRKNQSEVTGTNYSNYNFESFWLDLKYLLSKSKKFTSSVELLFRSTFYSNGNQMVESQKLILGDAGNEQALFLNGGYQINHSFFVFGKVGINWPENVLSPESIYDVKFSFLWKPIRLDLGLGGTISFYKSPYPSLQAARSAFNLNTGASNLFVSWNRQSTIPYLELSYLLGEINLGLNVKQIVAGKSTDNGTSVGLFISYHIGEPKEPFKGFSHKYGEFRFLGNISQAEKDYVKIPFGYSEDLEKGDVIYFFKKLANGKEILMATGSIEEIGVNWSVIKVLEKLNKISIDESLLVKVLIKEI